MAKPQLRPWLMEGVEPLESIAPISDAVLCYSIVALVTSLAFFSKKLLCPAFL